jgi:hypothetical protein
VSRLGQPSLTSPFDTVMSSWKHLTLWIIALSALVGCGHSVHEGQLVGSWQLDIQVADARVTYYPDHTWVMTLSSSRADIPNSSEFGKWKLQGDHLVTTTFSTLGNTATRALETSTITKLEEKALELKSRDQSGRIKTTTFHRANSPAAPVSDEDCRQGLAGTWTFSDTNSQKKTGALLYSSYRADGGASWRGTIYRESGSQPAPFATGLWRVQGGLLYTSVTNSEGPLPADSKEERDEIIFLTPSQFTYRDEQGMIHKVVHAR